MAEVTNHTAEFVWSQMPYARGLQYIQIWWENKGVTCLAPGKATQGNRMD